MNYSFLSSKNFILKFCSVLIIAGLIWTVFILYADYVSFRSSQANSDIPTHEVVTYPETFEVMNVTDVDTLPKPVLPIIQSILGSAIDPAALYSGSDYDYFFENTVFVGDSLSVGFKNYCDATATSLKQDTTSFLVKEGCSAKIMLSENAFTRYARFVPTYNNQMTYIEDAIALMPNTEKVFVCYGMNDLVDSTPDDFVTDMITLINRIKEKSPDVSIYIMTIPPIMGHVNHYGLSNANIISANDKLQGVCFQNDWGFINIGEYLMISDRSINPIYSSDNYVHEKMNAFEIWEKALRNYAYESLK